MCHKGTLRAALFLVAVTAGTPWLASGQTLDWRRIGGSSVDLGLAGPATGPVDQVWFSEDGSTLYARTHSSRLFQTNDFETWLPAVNPPAPPPLSDANPRRRPAQGGRVVAVAWNRGSMFDLGTQLLRSDDQGETWQNLTAYRSASVIGAGQRGLAMTRDVPDQLVVANGDGVWRSMDGGLSWTGLNQFLPNLTIKRILAAPSGAVPLLAESEGMGVLALPPGGTVWSRLAGVMLPDEAYKQAYSRVLGAEITAIGSAGNTVYAGSANGQIWISTGGGPFRPSDTRGAAGRVERIFVDPTRTTVALAVLSGKGPHVLRTMNMNYWDPIDGNLPDVSARGVTADRASGAVYVATEKGVFWTTTDLETASGIPPVWTSLPDKLQSGLPAADVLLDPAGVQLYAAFDGYGIFAMAAPHRQLNLQIVNAADFSRRPAAPGSLLSVVGGRVDSARGGDLNYPVLAVVGNESQIQVPFEAVGPSVNLALQVAGGGTVHRDVAVRPVSPAILVSRDGAPMLWDADTGLPLDVRNPARPNMRVQIWATGLGKVKPDWPTGMQARMEDPPTVVAAMRAFLDDTPLPVTRATLLPGYVGFYLVEVELPPITNSGTSQLYISADGQESNRVIVVIAP